MTTRELITETLWAAIYVAAFLTALYLMGQWE